MPAYLVEFPDVLGRTLIDAADRYVVFAADVADAKAMVNDRFAGDSTALVNDATFTEIEAGTDLAGFSLNVKVSPITPAINVTVEADGSGAVAATGTLTFDDNPADGETVTIGATVYTFATGAIDAAFKVDVGADASGSLDNLIAAINLTGTAGVTYGVGTTIHPTVSAAAGAGDTLVATAKTAGTAGNSISTTEALDGAWDDVTLVGGLDADTIDDLATRMAAKLNADTVIDGAVYDASTQELIVAVGSGGDDLGAKTLAVQLFGPRGNTAVPGLVVSVTDGGISTDDLSVTFAADNYELPVVLAALKS